MKNLELKKNLRLLAILFVSVLAFNACSDDDHDDHDDHDHDDHDHEEINLVIYTLTNSENSEDTVVFTYFDEDGEFGQEAEISVEGQLTPSTTYNGALELYHVHEDGDRDNIGADIAEDEADEHEVFYTTTDLIINRVDKDANGNPLGMVTTVTTNETGNGPFTITLIHEGKKPNDGYDDALSEEGTIDVEAPFNVSY